MKNENMRCRSCNSKVAHEVDFNLSLQSSILSSFRMDDARRFSLVRLLAQRCDPDHSDHWPTNQQNPDSFS